MDLGILPEDDAARSQARGLRECRAAWLIGVTVREYRAFESGDRVPDVGTWDRIRDQADHDAIYKLYGWPQTFVAT